MAEIVSRYGEDHVVSRAARLGEPEFLAIEAEIKGLISESRESTRSCSR